MLSRLLPVVRCPSWTPPLFGAHAFRSVTFDANPVAFSLLIACFWLKIFFAQLSSAGRVGDVVLVKKRSADLLNDPLYNKVRSLSKHGMRPSLLFRGLVFLLLSAIVSAFVDWYLLAAKLAGKNLKCRHAFSSSFENQLDIDFPGDSYFESNAC